jgi:hypothetical protein
MDRKPILLSKNAVAWIQIFRKTDDIEDIFCGCYDLNSPKIWEEAAEEFVNQLKDEWSICFMETLRSKIECLLEKT